MGEIKILYTEGQLSVTDHKADVAKNILPPLEIVLEVKLQKNGSRKQKINQFGNTAQLFMIPRLTVRIRILAGCGLLSCQITRTRSGLKHLNLQVSRLLFLYILMPSLFLFVRSVSSSNNY